MVVVTHRRKIWNFMKVILLQNTEWHDGVRAEINCIFCFDRCRKRSTGDRHVKFGTEIFVDGEYCYNDT
jgi:hypothetical protein